MKLNTIQYIILILLIGSVNLFSSCKDDDGHDAGSPVVVNRFFIRLAVVPERKF